MKFGIWIEPEMVNEDSDLYRAHPDWAIQIRGKSRCARRNQGYCLIFPEEVRDCVFDQICAVLDQGKLIMSSDMNPQRWQMFMPEIFPMIMCLVSMISWSVCAAAIRIFCWRMRWWRRQV
ncbi:MAG: alpha-galactosidase [Mediterraneibacter gnavus]